MQALDASVVPRKTIGIQKVVCLSHGNLLSWCFGVHFLLVAPLLLLPVMFVFPIDVSLLVLCCVFVLHCWWLPGLRHLAFCSDCLSMAIVRCAFARPKQVLRFSWLDYGAELLYVFVPVQVGLLAARYGKPSSNVFV